PSNRWTSAEIRILIKEVGEHQQALQNPVLKERSKASIQQKWDTVFQKYREYFL
ncbi:12887_t:CDS:2, partial [Rhizophagus irregularis]